MFDSFGFQEMLVIAVVALVVFGPERLPELAREAAVWLRKFRASASSSLDDLRRAADMEDLEEELRSLRQELRGARDDVTRPLRGLGEERPRASDRSPPIDMEAT